MEEKRVADYFVVAGLPSDPKPLEQEATAECHTSRASEGLLPITDLAVIIRSQGESAPTGFVCIENTPSGLPADLNHGSLRSPSIFLCYRRGRDKPPLVDIGVLYENKQRILPDSEILKKTPYGRSANVNNSGSRTFLTYRRAQENAPCNQLVVTDICVILANKGETPPHAFCKIDRNLNKGMVGSDIFLCYKKSTNRPDLISYEPAILDRFPRDNYSSFPLPEQVPLFCLPMGATVECWPTKAQRPWPTFSTFVLTLGSAEKVYGASITFYERFPDSNLTASQRKKLNYEPSDDKVVYANKSICLFSHWPFFRTFERVLRFLYKLSLRESRPVPVERYISHFMLDIPFPSVQRPTIWIQLEEEHVSLSQFEDTPLPLSGASFRELLKTLGPDNCLCVLLLVLTEQKMLFHSLRPDVLTSVAEAVVALIFPFHWQCPYIPLCPLGLSDVLSAPLPFIVGVDSRYFDMYDPPHEVACIDLDTNTIFINEEKSFLSVKLLPKKPARTLRNNLQSLYEKVCLYETNAANIAPRNCTGDIVPFDRDIVLHKKERRLELEIQEAFLRFMAALLKDFRTYLRPITSAPKPGITDPNSLFDLQGFLKSRDKNYHRFYSMMMHTQMFIRFIEERSFVSDKDVSLAFFDECAERVDTAGESSEHLLLEVAGSSHNHEHTVFISPPEQSPGWESAPHKPFQGFDNLDITQYHKHPAVSLLNVPPEGQTASSSPMARRTKQEVKLARKAAKKQAEIPLMWAKCLAGTCYSVWFMHLPAYSKTFTSRPKALRVADEVLHRMQLLKLPAPDEVSYRVLMLMCGQYNQPALAVKILFDMKKNGIQPNAITYGYYNKAVLECPWPTGDSHRWAQLRNVVLAVSQFKQNLVRRQGERTSVASSRTSLEEPSSTRVSLDHTATGQMFPELLARTDDRGGHSDTGYSSANHEDSAKSSSHSSGSYATEGSQEFSGPAFRESAVSSRNEKCNGAARSLRFDELDFSESDQFRSRVGSIVRSSAGAYVNGGSLDDLMVASAGVLFASEAMRQPDTFLRSSTALRSAVQRRRRHRSAGMGNGNLSVENENGTNSSRAMSEREPSRQFVRSLSFGGENQSRERRGSGAKLDDTRLTPLVEATSPGEHVETAETDAVDGTVESVEDVVVAVTYEEEMENGKESVEQAPPEAMQSQEFAPHHKPTPGPLSPPLHSNVRSSSASPTNLARTFEQSKELFSATFSPLKDAWQQLDISSAAASLTSSLGLKTRKFSLGSHRMVSRSSTFHQGGATREKAASARSSPARSTSQMESLAEQAQQESPSPLPRPSVVSAKPGLSRSSTLPYSPRRRYVPPAVSKEAPPGGATTGSTNGTPASIQADASFAIPKLSAKHSEYIIDTFKFAALSMASRLTEIKESLSTSNTPTRSMSSSLPRGFDQLLLDDEDRGSSFSLESSRRQSTDTLSRGEGDVGEDGVDALLRDGPGTPLHTYGSMPSFLTQLTQNLDSLDAGDKQRVALDIIITSCSQCNNCRSLLYDEEIMDGWAADDSNLNTRCYFCNATLVPLLTVKIKDYRVEDLKDGRMSSAQSTDSIQSEPPFAHSPQIVKNVTYDGQTGDGGLQSPQSPQPPDVMSRPSSIDSGNDTFLLFEESPDAEKKEATGGSCSETPLGSPKRVDDGFASGAPGSLTEEGSALRHLSEPVDIPVVTQTSTDDLMTMDSPPRSVPMAELSSPTSTPAPPATSLPAQRVRKTGATAVMSAVPQLLGNLCEKQRSTSTPAIRMGPGVLQRPVCPLSPLASAFGPSVSLEPLTVPYLSPLVLRKEVENVLEHEGDDCMLSATFVDQHPIIYWNLIWYFKRLSLPSHLPQLSLEAPQLHGNRQIPDAWQGTEGKAINVICCWDNPKLHADMVPPMYRQLRKASVSPLVKSLVTEDKKSVTEQVLACVQHGNIKEAVQLLLRERQKTRTASRRPSLYRDILFLAIAVLGRETINQRSFDIEYWKAYDELIPTKRTTLYKSDKYPSLRAMMCRKFFRELELRPTT
ncbi:DENN domain-containing protein 4C-like [Ornithodoros turicata]|uniref:DENN domain-containing protein 4C-like n=1 Tax=Ornithodoros turicata TaxID=34597 RepID=UPI0031391627